MSSSAYTQKNKFCHEIRLLSVVIRYKQVCSLAFLFSVRGGVFLQSFCISNHSVIYFGANRKTQLAETQQLHSKGTERICWWCFRIGEWWPPYNTGHVLCHWLFQTSVAHRRSLVGRTPLSRSGTGERVGASPEARAAGASPVPWSQPWGTNWRNCRRRRATAWIPHDR